MVHVYTFFVGVLCARFFIGICSPHVISVPGGNLTPPPLSSSLIDTQDENQLHETEPLGPDVDKLNPGRNNILKLSFSAGMTALALTSAACDGCVMSSPSAASSLVDDDGDDADDGVNVMVRGRGARCALWVGGWDAWKGFLFCIFFGCWGFGVLICKCLCMLRALRLVHRC